MPDIDMKEGELNIRIFRTDEDKIGLTISQVTDVEKSYTVEEKFVGSYEM